MFIFLLEYPPGGCRSPEGPILHGYPFPRCGIHSVRKIPENSALSAAYAHLHPFPAPILCLPSCTAAVARPPHVQCRPHIA